MALYVVATPIGNLDDLTIRAQKTLAACEAVLAEDTRRTRQLLTHLGLSKPLRTLNAHAGESTIERIADEVAAGAELALVSDAGTPMVNDPGAELVRAVIARGGKVIPIPGASAILCALVGSGLASNGFRFVGFLPRGGGERAEALAKIVDTEEPVIFFEAGNRVAETLADLAARTPDRPAAIGRELTKLHEEFVRGTVGELAERSSEAMLGEVTIVLGTSTRPPPAAIDDVAIDARLDAELAAGRGAKEASDIVAAWSGRPRRELYSRAVARKKR